MNLLILCAKAAIAALLLVAAGAKLADLDAFASTVRLFLPGRGLPAASALILAAGSTLAELALGAASLADPAAGWLNPVVFGACCAFLAVSVTGFAVHRGRSCRCFGALTQRKFDLAAIGRGAVIAAAAAVAMRPAQLSAIQLGLAGRLLLLAAGGLLALATFTAARALTTGRTARPGWASS